MAVCAFAVAVAIGRYDVMKSISAKYVEPRLDNRFKVAQTWEALSLMCMRPSTAKVDV